MNPNNVNEDNFNDTMKGYCIRALQEMGADQKLKDKFMNGLSWAIDDMTMENAREEYQQYCKGKIKFKNK
jgi:hypothetical protein